MKSTRLFIALVLAGSLFPAAAAEPLSVFIRSGVNTDGPNQHDHPRFLNDWTKLLVARGARVAGAMEFPTADQLARSDVVVIYAADGMKIEGGQRATCEKFLQRGGGIVVIHDGVVSGDQHDWCRSVIGGAWRWPDTNLTREKATKWFEGEVGLYFVDPEHPITRGVSNFDWQDEVYNRLDMSPDVKVLAHSFVDVLNIWPQLWTYEKTWPGGRTPYRAFVSLPGHEYAVFQTPHYRAMLLRGIAWAGKRADVDEFCTNEELASLKYPAGGPKPASEAVKAFQLHPEFNITLAADESIAEKIIALDWDPQGRLWVVETPEYPGGRDVNKNDFKAFWNRAQNPSEFPAGGKEPRKPRDRISILEDSNGDSVMDRKIVFADGLELPTSFVFWKDGVIVSQAPDILFIRDTNGDGQADQIETLYTGWGTFDTHAVINNFRWGPDGWIYGTVGYTRGQVKSGERTKDFGDFSAGVYRFRPDGSAIEQIAAENCNTWGCEIAPDGEIVFTTATCGEPICHVVIPEKFLARGGVEGVKAYQNVIEENKIFPAFDEKRQPYAQIDWVGQWTAAAGATIYDGGAWPAKWAPDERYSFFMSEATRQIFHHEFLDPAGPTYQGRKEDGRKQTEFMTGTDYWFRPIHSRVGPEGAIYLVDFYNQIAAHNDPRGAPHGARNAVTRPDRDHHFTRLWRIQHKEAKLLPAWTLDRNDPVGLVKMLLHPNGWVRTTANRLLNETQPASSAPALQKMLGTGPTKYARIQALYALNNLGRLDESLILTALRDTEGAVRKSAARLTAERGIAGDENRRAVEALLNDKDGRARIQALMALGSLPATRESAAAIVSFWPDLKDKWTQSAAIGATAKDPLLYLERAFAARAPALLADFFPHIARVVANKGEAALASRFVVLLAEQPARMDALKAATLEALVANLNADVKPAVSADLIAAFKSLLGAGQAASSVLPLVARWNAGAALAAEVKPAVAKATAALANPSLSDDARGQVAVNLVGVRALDPNIIPVVTTLIGSPEASSGLQQRVITALGSTSEGGMALVGAFPRINENLVEPAFAQIIKRNESANAFLDLLANQPGLMRRIGPARVHRFRTHGDAAIAKRANQIVDDLAGPEAREKDALIAKLRPEIEKPGNAENGRKVYTANCAGCHIFKNEGRNLAPNLTGMGAHGPADLLVHIVDPNRVVEPNFISVNITTREGDSFSGIIDRENASEVVLRDATTDHTLRVANIATRTSTGRSVMPEGLEALGAESLRDLLTYLCADDSRFRILDLTGAFTANNSRGLYNSPENPDEATHFNRYGIRRVEDVPFDIISPDKSIANVVVLKGGPPGSFAHRAYPRRVEVKVGVAASRLHFFGGVAGWGHPTIGDKLDALKVTLHFADGTKEEMIFRNGVEIADYNGRHEVAGSRGLNWTLGSGQVRWHKRDVSKRAVLDKLTLESFDNALAPTVFAITAELAP